MPNKISYIIFSSTLSVVVKGKTYTISKEDSKYVEALDLTLNNKEEDLYRLLNVTSIIAEDLGIEINNGLVTYNGESLPKALNRMIVAMHEQRLTNIQPLINFWNKLKLNPSYRPLNFLSDFIEANNVVINESGNLILYKIVARTKEPDVFRDLYTGRFEHRFGVPLSMPRNKVDDNIDNTCSYGFHACCWNYIPHYGNAVSGNDAIILVEVDPQDIVAIPKDYNNSKLRVCKYIPISEYKFADGQLKEVLFQISEETSKNPTVRSMAEVEDRFEDDDDDENDWDDEEY